MAAYNEICARATTLACIPEPEPGEKVDGLADRVMFRLAYRNFGDHESLVANHTVLGGALGGVRWYEIRNPAGADRFSAGNRSSIPTPTSGWGVAMDRAGNIAVGFNAMSKQLFQRLRGRAQPSDPPGPMFGPLAWRWAPACSSIRSNAGATTAA